MLILGLTDTALLWRVLVGLGVVVLLVLASIGLGTVLRLLLPLDEDERDLQ